MIIVGFVLGSIHVALSTELSGTYTPGSAGCLLQRRSRLYHLGVKPIAAREREYLAGECENSVLLLLPDGPQ